MDIQPRRFSLIKKAPILMTWSERTILYALIFSLRPQHCLEIGTHKGGSAMIICAALDDLGIGDLTCIDPIPLVSEKFRKKYLQRAYIITGSSPEVIAIASQNIKSTFDFVLIDGLHTREGVVADIEGVLPFLSQKAYMLFHDAHYFEVEEAIDLMLNKYSDHLIDCGMISTEQTKTDQIVDGKLVVWGGLRLVCYHSH